MLRFFTFHFVSSFQGESHYEVRQAGDMVDSRLRVKGDVLTFSDGRSVAPELIEAFNESKYRQWSEARALYGDHVPAVAPVYRAEGES